MMQGKGIGRMGIYEREIEQICQEELPWEELKGSTVLISGATGGVGKCLTDILMFRKRVMGQRFRILALSRRESVARERFADYWEEEGFEYLSCDINQKIPECGKAEYVIHGASNTHPLQYARDPVGTITANVFGTRELLEYGAAHGMKRFCFLSSVEIYGENRGDVESFDESYLGFIDCNTVRAGYPESKRLGEALCNAYGQAYGVEFVIPRLSRIYGPTTLPDDSKAAAQFIKKAAAGEDIVLKSEGTQKYSYTFVTDAAMGILYTLLRGQSGKAYNIADRASDVTLREMAGILARLAGTRVVYELPGEEECRGYSAQKVSMLDASALRALGWLPRVHLHEGLECCVEAVRGSFDGTYQ